MNSEKEEYILLGRIAKTHGIKGELNVVLDIEVEKNFKLKESVFIEINNKRIPFFVIDFKINFSNKSTILLDSIDSVEKAKTFVGKNIYLSASNFETIESNEFYIHELSGYLVSDVSHGVLGTVTEILDFPQHSVIQIFKNKIELLIPLADEIVKEINHQQKTILVDTPEGLIDLYWGQKKKKNEDWF